MSHGHRSLCHSRSYVPSPSRELCCPLQERQDSSFCSMCNWQSPESLYTQFWWLQKRTCKLHLLEWEEKGSFQLQFSNGDGLLPPTHTHTHHEGSDESPHSKCLFPVRQLRLASYRMLSGPLSDKRLVVPDQGTLRPVLASFGFKSLAITILGPRVQLEITLTHLGSFS
jgi:hypothetical protein